MGHKWDHLDLDDLNYKKRTYNWFNAYNQSKLCNILFTKELALLTNGKGVTVNALHPGAVATDILNKDGFLSGIPMFVLLKVAGKNPELGAQTTIYLAVSDEVFNTSGEYFVDCKVTKSSKKSRDPGLAKRLWEISEEEAGLKEEEMHYLN
ncbi:UNVERIFIED_CONTAM: hypothetical protein GTU68_064224 [Idotea baltica]|nr:hypothetical protein [Idotea baltica]